jgi:hypothetical protein
MASNETGAKRTSSAQIFDCESIEIPPGTKNYARLPRGLEEESSPMHRGWLVGTVAVVALVIGAVIGRFLLG